MNSVANQLRHRLRLFVPAVLLLMLPFVAVVPRAAAMDEHSMHTEQHSPDMDCAAACARAANTPPTQGVLHKNETRTPNPEPKEIISYHAQFLATPSPKKLSPAALYSSMPARPPDIVKLSGHFLF